MRKALLLGLVGAFVASNALAFPCGGIKSAGTPSERQTVMSDQGETSTTTTQPTKTKSGSEG